MSHSIAEIAHATLHTGDESIEHAKRAIALDDGDAQAHETMAILLLHSGNHEAAIFEARRAVEINPNFAHAHIPLGNSLSLAGKPAEGIPYLEKAIRLNPDDIRGHIYLALLADAHLNNRGYDLAAEWARKSIERKRDFPHPYMTLASALGHQGKIQEATTALTECLRLHPGYLKVHPILEFYQDPTDKDHYLEGLRVAGLPE
jgi:tetratricopeptide (TPR) repeat protein